MEWTNKINKLGKVVLVSIILMDSAYIIMNFLVNLYRSKLGLSPELFQEQSVYLMPFILGIMFMVSFYLSFACLYDLKEVVKKIPDENPNQVQIKEAMIKTKEHLHKFFLIQALTLFYVLVAADAICSMIIGFMK